MTWCDSCAYEHVEPSEYPCNECDAVNDDAPTRYQKAVVEPTPTPVKPVSDNINHPSHYCDPDGMESIDEMVLVFGKEAVKHFCICNVWKYRYRASNKNGEEDIKKSHWYMRKYKELSEGEEPTWGDPTINIR